MTDQWEYKAVAFWRESKGWTPDGERYFYPSIEFILDPWGAQGWELVSVAAMVDMTRDAYRAFFKRRKA